MTHAITARHDLPIWRNDDYYEYPIRVIGVDLTGIVLKMDVRLEGDTPGPPLIALRNVSGPLQGLWLVGVTIVDGVPVSDLRIRIDRPNLQALDYTGDFGEAAEFAYALLFGGRTRLYGNIILPPHAFGSDAAPDDRVPSYGYGRQAGVPDAGVTLTISQDGGLTLMIDGAGIVSASAGQADAAAERAAEALAQTEAITTRIPRAVDDYAGREAIPLAMRGNGLRVYVKGERDFEWSTDLFGPGGWTGLLTEEELTRLNLAHGTLDPALVGGLNPTLAAHSSAIADLQARLSIASLRIDSFTVTPSQAELGSTVSSLAMAWSYIGGTPNGQSIERSDGQRVTGISPSERTATAEKLPAPAGVLVIGDSQPWEWAPEYAAALNIPLALAARPAHTIYKQAIMVGADPLTLTIAGGTLPAAGTKATVTLVNGGTTTAANPAAILHSALTGVDSIQVDLVVAGGTRRCTLSHDITNALDIYKIEQAAGGSAVAVADGALAVPTFKAMAATTHRVAIMAGHNDMLDHDPAGGFAGIRARTESIMALCADNLNPVQLNDFWPAANVQEIAQIPFIQAHSQWLRDRYPGAITLDVAGRTLWERLRGADKTIPANLRKPDDTLHLNATGRVGWTAHNLEDNTTRRLGVAPLTGSVSFTLRGRGAVPGLPVVESASTVTVSFLAKAYWGVAASASPTDEQLRAASQGFATARGRSITYNASAGGFPMYAWPAALGAIASVTVGGIAFTAFTVTTRDVVNAMGATVSMNILVFTTRQTGAAIGVNFA